MRKQSEYQHYSVKIIENLIFHKIGNIETSKVAMVDILLVYTQSVAIILNACIPFVHLLFLPFLYFYCDLHLNVGVSLVQLFQVFFLFSLLICTLSVFLLACLRIASVFGDISPIVVISRNILSDKNQALRI